MDVIYSQAEKVIVWLGEDVRSEVNLIKTMQLRFRNLSQAVHDLHHEASYSIDRTYIIQERLPECLEKAKLPTRFTPSKLPLVHPHSNHHKDPPHNYIPLLFRLCLTILSFIKSIYFGGIQNSLLSQLYHLQIHPLTLF